MHENSYDLCFKNKRFIWNKYSFLLVFEYFNKKIRLFLMT